jgi:hypothetical protein
MSLLGLGLHLQKVAQKFPRKYDLHQPDRLLQSLSPYDHLHRLFRLCTVHGMRNICQVSAPESVRNLMRSLMCMEHPDWDRTIHDILSSGIKAAVGEYFLNFLGHGLQTCSYFLFFVDWITDKTRSKFALEAMCWEKSFIPKIVWKAGEKESNLIEGAHSDVNLEGVHCTLVGGIKKGEHFDNVKMKTLSVSIYFVVCLKFMLDASH